MDNTTIIIGLDIAILLFLVGMVVFHIRLIRKHNHQKTEKIEQELETERAKTEKFHVSIEEIRKLTKG